MEPLADTVIEDDRWSALDLGVLADQATRAAFAAADLPAQGFAVCVMGADDARIAALNAAWRGKDAPTNVLSWPAEDLADDVPGAPPAAPLPGEAEDPWSVGDVALAWETCAREALDQGKPLKDHVLHLIVHGTLHCLGYDHERDDDAVRMEGIELRALATLGVENPY